MLAKVSGYDQLAADDIASAMGRVQTQITWSSSIIAKQDALDIFNPDFFNEVAKELDLLMEYWVKLRAARNRLIGDDAVAF